MHYSWNFVLLTLFVVCLCEEQVDVEKLASLWETPGLDAKLPSLTLVRELLQQHYPSTMLAQQTQAYQLLYGVDRQHNCEQALKLFFELGEKVVSAVEEKKGRVVPLSMPLMHLSAVDSHSPVGEGDENTHLQQFLASAGDLSSQKVMGLRYLIGRGVPVDFELAFQNFEAASSYGDPEAMHNLAYMYMEGLGTEQDYESALELFYAASLAGIPEAWNALGFMYYHGLGATKNVSYARQCFQLAASEENMEGIYNLGLMAQDEDGDNTTALKYFKVASHLGHWRAPYLAAKLYDKGDVVDRSCRRACFLLKRSVEEYGDSAQLLRNATLKFVEDDLQSALHAFIVLAAAGFPVGLNNLAWLVLRGYVGGSGDEEKEYAFNVAQLSAAQHDARGLNMVGDCYYYGIGTHVDHSLALDAYLGSDTSQAMFSAAYMFYHGEGVERNLTAAAYYCNESIFADEAIASSLPAYALSLQLEYSQCVHSLLSMAASLSQALSAVFGGVNVSVKVDGDGTLLAVLCVLVVLLFWRFKRQRGG